MTGVELLNQALGMNPAESMGADVERAGVVAEDDAAGGQPMHSADVRPGVAALPTGAWYGPPDDGGSATPLERHGNPNALTRDKGTSKLAQGASANSTLVEVARFDKEPPEQGSHVVTSVCWTCHTLLFGTSSYMCRVSSNRALGARLAKRTPPLPESSTRPLFVLVEIRG